MKTLILYATKHGATREIAQRIARQMDAALVDLNNGSVPALDGYDCVLIGSCVYAGQLRKEAKAFVIQHADALKAKPLGLFVSGIAQDGGVEGYLDANYPTDVVAHAKAKALLGGVSDPTKQNFFEKLVMRMVTKKSAYTSTISDEKIKQFVEAMKA